MTTRIQLRGLNRRRRVLGAVLALNGSSVSNLRQADVRIRELSTSHVLVAVDGGLRTCRSARRRPDLFVGDADSVDRPPDGVPSVVLSTDKDLSDFAAALAEVRKMGAEVVAVAGLIGGRLDHEWANLFELGAHARHFAGIVCPSRRGAVVVTARGCRGPTEPGNELSLFCLGGTATVTLRGTRWKLHHARIRPGSRGLSNLTGRSLDLTVHAGVVAVVFSS